MNLNVKMLIMFFFQYCENADLDMLIKRIRLLDCFDKSHTDFLLPLLQLAGNDKISEVYEIEKFYVEQVASQKEMSYN